MNNSFALDFIPPNDPERLAALERYRLLDTPAEKVFDNITELAADLFGTPVALISLVGAETVFFKSAFGASTQRCADRGESLCALAILSPEVTVIENTLDSPAVAGSVPVRQGVRFYAGAPLKTADEYCIGTVCVADFKPRSFSEKEIRLLRSLSRLVVEQIELRLTAMNQDEIQERRLAQRDEFIGVASHELRTPLTSLSATLQLLQRVRQEDQPEKFAALVSQANRATEKLKRLVADLLDVKRIAAGQVPLAQTVFRIGQLIEECCGHVRAAGNYHLRLSGDTGLEVFADFQKIDQVMVNLVNNAVKYAPDSHEIDIRVSRRGAFARIAVQDYGPGIMPEHLPRIFERYYRSASHNVSGLGLGLYIISEIIKQHGGEAGAESKPGKGSTFWFTLPLA